MALKTKVVAHLMDSLLPIKSYLLLNFSPMAGQQPHTQGDVPKAARAVRGGFIRGFCACEHQYSSKPWEEPVLRKI